MQNLKYPIYIVSKNRYENPITAKYFLKEKINFLIAVEKNQYKLYLKTIPPNNILCLPFANLKLGSFPARNYCWEHSIKNNYQKHFIFDDNIYGFVKFIKGKRIKCSSLEALKALIKITERYKNIGISGYNYKGFVIPKDVKKAFYINTHVYSGMLINNNMSFRWRLKYNEDVDLCLQTLHNKWTTILLNIYSIKKVSTTMKMKEGNQDELYKNNNPDKKRLKVKSLETIWPQYVKTIMRFGRYHHYVNWNKHFTHPLIKAN